MSVLSMFAWFETFKQRVILKTFEYWALFGIGCDFEFLQFISQLVDPRNFVLSASISLSV